MDWPQIISLVINLVLGGGFIVTVVTLRSTRRKQAAEAGKSEVDLTITQHTAEQLMDKDKSERIVGLIDEARSLRTMVEQLLDEKVELLKQVSNLEIKIVQLTEALQRSEMGRKKTRCDRLECLKRIPPYEVDVTLPPVGTNKQ